MKLTAVMLTATLMLSGAVLAQSSGPSADGAAGGGQGAKATTTGQALNSARKAGDSGPPIAQAAPPAKPDLGSASNAAGVNRGAKADRRGEHYP